MREGPFVFDTSTLISAALITTSTPRQALVWAAEHGELLASEATFDELVSRLHRPKFARYLDTAERAAFLDWFGTLLLFVEATEPIRASRDPDDDKFLEVAVSGRAAYLVSSDGDLLALHPFRGVPILRPAAFLAAVVGE